MVKFRTINGKVIPINDDYRRRINKINTTSQKRLNFSGIVEEDVKRWVAEGLLNADNLSKADEVQIASQLVEAFKDTYMAIGSSYVECVIRNTQQDIIVSFEDYIRNQTRYHIEVQKEKEIEELRNQLNNAEKTITSLNILCGDLKIENDKLKRECATKREIIKEAEEYTKKREKEIAELQELIISKNQEITNLKREIKELRASLGIREGRDIEL